MFTLVFVGLFVLSMLYTNVAKAQSPTCLNMNTPALKNSAGDGIPDILKERGIDSNCDGAIDLNLKALGADPKHKDIFVEVDSLKGHPIFIDAEKLVTKAFANAPVSNPDGTKGIHLHIINSDSNITATKVCTDDRDLPGYRNNWIGDRNDNLFTRNAKMSVFHYALIADVQCGGNYGSSGIAFDIPAMMFEVTLGVGDFAPDPLNPGVKVGSIDQQAGTFMHELGHTLGLHHGGGSDNTLFKPNYFSVMNYVFQLSSLTGFRPIDYSHCVAPALDENHLDESAGIGNSTCPGPFASDKPAKTAVYGSSYYYGPAQCGGQMYKSIPANGTSVDFGGGGNSKDIPEDLVCDRQLRVIKSNEDWSNLIYMTRDPWIEKTMTSGSTSGLTSVSEPESTPGANGGLSSMASSDKSCAHEFCAQTLEYHRELLLNEVARSVDNIPTPPPSPTGGLSTEASAKRDVLNKLGVPGTTFTQPFTSPTGGVTPGAGVGGSPSVETLMNSGKLGDAINQLNVIENTIATTLPSAPSSSTAGVGGQPSATTKSLDLISNFKAVLTSQQPAPINAQRPP